MIVEVGGFLGMGQKDVAITWGELSVAEEGITVDATEEQLENAPEFVSLEQQRREAELQAQQEVAQATMPTDEQTGQQTEPAEVEGAQ